ncbi:hypothetical protein [Nocardia sp. NRRL S-836]|uniref:hypothetical protein n=1 Tax=Nocardia sp. NRRL S-836 TaxID=1519492 RepID=UPI0006B024FC|nr:hypothetical protein [Nocardia sp. NRRL S-836]KOV90032.1 hypothetical protein ADL03_01290 [Nocardia sp. NRRL S-836]
MLKTRATLLAAAFVLFGLIAWLTGRPPGIDSAVYRSGALAVLAGEPLYEHLRSEQRHRRRARGGPRHRPGTVHPERADRLTPQELFAKLGVRDRAQAIVAAYEMGIVVTGRLWSRVGTVCGWVHP